MRHAFHRNEASKAISVKADLELFQDSGNHSALEEKIKNEFRKANSTLEKQRNKLETELDKISLPARDSAGNADETRELKKAYLLSRLQQTYGKKKLPSSIEALVKEWDLKNSSLKIAQLANTMDSSTNQQFRALQPQLDALAITKYRVDNALRDKEILNTLKETTPESITENTHRKTAISLDRMETLDKEKDWLTKDREIFERDHAIKLSAPGNVGDDGQYSHHANAINAKLGQLQELYQELKDAPNNTQNKNEYLARRKELTSLLGGFREYIHHFKPCLHEIARQHPNHNSNMNIASELDKKLNSSRSSSFQSGTVDIEKVNHKDTPSSYGSMEKKIYDPNTKKYKKQITGKPWDPKVAEKALLHFKTRHKPLHRKQQADRVAMGMCGVGSTGSGLSTGLFGDGTERDEFNNLTLVKFDSPEALDDYIQIYNSFYDQEQEKQRAQIDGENKGATQSKSSAAWRTTTPPPPAEAEAEAEAEADADEPLSAFGGPSSGGA